MKIAEKDAGSGYYRLGKATASNMDSPDKTDQDI